MGLVLVCHAAQSASADRVDRPAAGCAVHDDRGLDTNAEATVAHLDKDNILRIRSPT
jgi:hypothetical protein